jgi:FtsP/CotA-like multicopper oxidase with cupredoxin domain
MDGRSSTLFAVRRSEGPVPNHALPQAPNEATSNVETRRRALLLSGSAAALAAVGLSRWAQGAPTAAQALPIPRLIEARNGEPVTLALQRTQHSFGGGATVPARGISSSYLGPVVRVRSGETVSFRVENRLG